MVNFAFKCRNIVNCSNVNSNTNSNQKPSLWSSFRTGKRETSSYDNRYLNVHDSTKGLTMTRRYWQNVIKNNRTCRLLINFSFGTTPIPLRSQIFCLYGKYIRVWIKSYLCFIVHFIMLLEDRLLHIQIE